jgi:glutathione S-transferase
MQFCNRPAPAPKPRGVQIFLADKVIAIPMEDAALIKGEHKAPACLARNSLGRTPVLELDARACLSETVSICRSLASLCP